MKIQSIGNLLDEYNTGKFARFTEIVYYVIKDLTHLPSQQTANQQRQPGNKVSTETIETLMGILENSITNFNTFLDKLEHGQPQSSSTTSSPRMKKRHVRDRTASSSSSASPEHFISTLKTSYSWGSLKTLSPSNKIVELPDQETQPTRTIEGHDYMNVSLPSFGGSSLFKDFTTSIQGLQTALYATKPQKTITFAPTASTTTTQADTFSIPPSASTTVPNSRAQTPFDDVMEKLDKRFSLLRRQSIEGILFEGWEGEFATELGQLMP